MFFDWGNNANIETYLYNIDITNSHLTILYATF